MKIVTVNVLNRPEDYDERVDSCLERLLQHNPDVVTIQEAVIERMETVRSAADKLGYQLYWRKDNQDIDGRTDTTAILLHHQTVDFISSSQLPGIDAMWVEFALKSNDRHMIAISYHGAWGAENQHSRLLECSRISQFARDQKMPVILGGDFNATPGERCIRYMLGDAQGVDINDWAYWIEAQNVARGLDPDYKPIHTSLNRGLASQTAWRHNIDVRYLPERQIDYLMNYGWSYGHPGGFTGRVHAIDISDVSDHNALVAEALD